MGRADRMVRPLGVSYATNLTPHEKPIIVEPAERAVAPN
jgi:hypothetical protein